MAGEIFICYRRRDASSEAARLKDSIETRFGRGTVFLDTSGIRAGAAFPDVIRRALDQCATVLPVIGPKWLTSGTDEYGIRPIDRPDDWVRRELEEAIALGKRVIPVLVNEVRMPPAEVVPESIRSIVNCEAVDIRHKYWDHDVELLIQALALGSEHTPLEPPRSGAIGPVAARRADGGAGGAEAPVQRRDGEGRRPSERLTNLPAPQTLIGRDSLIEQFTGLMRESSVRMMVLTGPAGVGKTVLAVRVANALAPEFMNGVYLIDLARSAGSDPVAEAGRVMPMVEGSASGATADSADSLSVRDALRAQQVLLVFDGLRGATAAMPSIVDMVEHCREVKVLITAQETLTDLPGWAQQRRVPALQLPDKALGRSLARPDLDRILASPAVQLLIDRVRAAGETEFALDHGNAGGAASLCRRLDGLPLAIEVVAALVPFVPLEEIHLPIGGTDRLQRAFDLAYAQLDAPEQALFRQLSVFVGGCTSEVMEEVCVARDPSRTIRRRLVMNNMLSRTKSDRFQMLHPIREYAASRMTADERSEVLGRYVRYYSRLAHCAEPHLTGADRQKWMDALLSEYENVREVLKCTLDNAEPQEIQLGLEMAGSLFWFWNLSGMFAEGQQWAKKAQALLQREHSAELRARLLYCDGGLAFLMGDYQEAHERLTASTEAWRCSKNEAGLAYALVILGMVKKEQNRNLEEAEQHEREAVALFEQLGDRWGLALAMNDLGNVLVARGTWPAGKIEYARSLEIWDGVKDPWGKALTLSNLARLLAVREGKYDDARSHQHTALTMQEQAGDPWGIAWSHFSLGDIIVRQIADATQAGRAVAQEQFQTAARHLQESFSRHWALGRKQMIAESLEDMVVLAVMLKQPTCAAQMAAAAQRLHTSGRAPVEDPVYEASLASLAKTIGEAEYERAFAEGQRWTLDELLSHVEAYATDWCGDSRAN